MNGISRGRWHKIDTIGAFLRRRRLVAIRYFVTGLLLVFSVGCGTVTTDLKNHPLYKDVVGEHFVLNVDCYYGHYYDTSRKALRLYPTSDPEYSFKRFSQVPADPSNIGKRVESVVIKGVFPAGTKFEVVRAIEFANMITQGCKIVGEFDVDGKKVHVNLYMMLRSRTIPPPFENKKYFERVDAAAPQNSP